MAAFHNYHHNPITSFLSYLSLAIPAKLIKNESPRRHRVQSSRANGLLKCRIVTAASCKTVHSRPSWFWAPPMMLSDPSAHASWAEVAICARKQTTAHAQGTLNINCSKLQLRLKSTHSRNNLSRYNKHWVEDFQRDWSEATWESKKLDLQNDMTRQVRYYRKMPWIV